MTGQRRQYVMTGGERPTAFAGQWPSERLKNVVSGFESRPRNTVRQSKSIKWNWLVCRLENQRCQNDREARSCSAKASTAVRFRLLAHTRLAFPAIHRKPNKRRRKGGKFEV